MPRTIAIMGVCAPERRTYAERTAVALSRPLHLLRYADLRVSHALPLPARGRTTRRPWSTSAPTST